MKINKTLKQFAITALLNSREIEQHVKNELKKSYPGTQHIEDTKENDVFIVGFPKSGNTWLQYLVASLIYGVDAGSARLTQELVPDVHYKKYYQRYSEFMCFKSHLLPQKEYARVIYIVRDGRDVMVSYWYYIKAISGQELNYDELVRSPILSFGTWGEHARAWIENKYAADILYIRYEDLLKDEIVEIKKIADFLSVKKTDKELLNIIEINSFCKLKENEKKMKLLNDVWDHNDSFYRKGKSGSYKEDMPLAACEIFKSMYENELERFKYI